MIDSRQRAAKHSLAMLVKWKRGDNVLLVAAVSNDDAKETCPFGWTTLMPCLRIAPQSGCRVAG